MRKTVLITGATSGLGLAFAKLHAEMNNRLILVARNQDKLQKIKDGLNTEVETMICDLTNSNQCLALCQRLINTDNIPDILINNAGMGGIYKFDEAPFDDEERMIALNITAVVCLCNQLAKYMKEKNTKTYILNIASAASFVAGAYQANYYATKAYILSYSRALTEECKQTSLSVTCFCPSRIKTNFHKAAGSRYEGKIMTAEKAAQIAHLAMLKKKAVIITPLKMFFMAGLLTRLLPSSWVSLYTRLKNEQLLNAKNKQQ